MTRLLGAILLFLGATGAGLEGTRRLTARMRTLEDLLHALALMEGELGSRLTPMPELLTLLAKETSPTVRGFFARCGALLGSKPFGTVWEESISTLHIKNEERRALAALGPILGRYDGESQRQALRRCREELEVCLDQAKGDRERLGRLYTTLGVSAGALLVILLF